MFVLRASGVIYIKHSTRKAARSIFFYFRGGIASQPNTSYDLHCGVWGIFDRG